MGAGLELVSHPIDSCAIDWWQGTYRLANNDRLDDLHGFTVWLSDQVLPGEDWVGPTSGKHFAACRRHPAGIMFSYSPWQSAAGDLTGVRNEGLASIEVTGRFLASVDAGFRQNFYATAGTLPGFYRCNRLDAQITVLNPKVDALAVVGMVERRELWPVGFGRGQAYCERLYSGEIVGAVTQYFGAKTSRVRARIYDKAAEQGWAVPAVRFEVQERREVADQHFRQLVRLSQTEASTPPLLVTAEDRTVRNIVGAELDLRDTSAWKDRERPQNWAQYAPTPGWWKETIAQPVSPIAVQYRKPADLGATYGAALDQYGRKVALEWFRRAVVEDTTFEYQALLWGLSGAQRWRREDLALVLDLLPPEVRDDARDYWVKCTSDAAEYSEEVVEPGFAPPCG